MLKLIMTKHVRMRLTCWMRSVTVWRLVRRFTSKICVVIIAARLSPRQEWSTNSLDPPLIFAKLFVAMMQHEGLVAELLALMLEKFLDVRDILQDLHTTRWCIIHLIDATRLLVALVVNGAPTTPKRPLRMS